MEAGHHCWMACSLCGVRVEARGVQEYAVNVYPKLANTEAHGGCNI